MKFLRSKGKWGWRGWRRVSQALFLFLFIYLTARVQVPRGFNQYLFDLAARGQDLRLPTRVTFFFDLDPLVGLGTMISAWTLKPALLPSLAVLLGVLVMGRFFCGFVCPFGTLNHFFTQKPRKKNPVEKAGLNRPRPDRRVKYYLLSLFLLAALLGSNQTGLLDPISFLFRSLTLAVFPALSFLSDEAMTLIAQAPKPFGLVSFFGPYVLDPIVGFGFRAYQGAFIFGGLFIFILALNRIRPRYFCRVLCPLGALLGLFSRYAVLNLTKDRELCTDCGLCRADCQGACGPHPDESWLRSECHLCFNCQAACPTGALKFKFQFSRPGPEPSPLPAQDAPDLRRRAVLASLAGGAALVGFGRVSLAAPERPQPTLVRPPGSLAEAQFLERCVRCGLCLKVCPTNVLVPALSEAGWEGLWTPRLDFHLGYCEYNCTLCSSVCPTGAIRTITGREKTETPIVIGSAFIDRGRCLPWSGQGPCLVCEEHCPTSPKAIYLVSQDVWVESNKTDRLLAPHLNLSRCVGCGVCAFKCPVKGKPAIYVNSVGETRSVTNRILLPE